MFFLSCYVYLPCNSSIPLRCHTCKYIFVDRLIKTITCMHPTKENIEFDIYRKKWYACFQYVEVCLYCKPLLINVLMIEDKL
jgi:hypothetical protein